jgi:hypothetical protein
MGCCLLGCHKALLAEKGIQTLGMLFGGQRTEMAVVEQIHVRACQYYCQVDNFLFFWPKSIMPLSA